jgi:rhamnose transport system permease protein
MTKQKRVIIAELEFSWKKFFLKWEWFLVLIFIGVNILNICVSPIDKGTRLPIYMSLSGLFNATLSFLEKAFIALPMAYILVLGDIDISVGSTVALSAVIMAESYNKLGLPMGICVIIALLVGTLCGFINGFILTKFTELAPMIVTLGTQILFRGIATIILKDQASQGLTNVAWFSQLYWGKLGAVPYIFIIFILCAIIFGFILHKTTFGRRLYAIGSNRIAAEYAGIQVQKIRCIVFTITGTFSAVTAIFLASCMGSARPNIASGYELDAISMVVLGGISTAGGKGNFVGAIIAIFIIGFLRYGLGLINVSSQVMLVIIGGLLIGAVMLPNLKIKGLVKKKTA